MAILRRVIKGLRRFIFNKTITSKGEEELERAYREYYSSNNEVISK